MNPFSEGELMSALLLLFIVLGIGSKLVAAEPGLRLIGVRLAFVVFLVGIVVGWSDGRPADAQDWLGILVSSLSLAAFALGICWTVLAILAFLYRHLVSPPLEMMHSWSAEAPQRRAQRRAARSAQRDAARAAAAYARAAPERERQRLQAETAARDQRDHQRRARMRGPTPCSASRTTRPSSATASHGRCSTSSSRTS